MPHLHGMPTGVAGVGCCGGTGCCGFGRGVVCGWLAFTLQASPPGQPGVPHLHGMATGDGRGGCGRGVALPLPSTSFIMFVSAIKPLGSIKRSGLLPQ